MTFQNDDDDDDDIRPRHNTADDDGDDDDVRGSRLLRSRHCYCFPDYHCCCLWCYIDDWNQFDWLKSQ